MDLNHPVLIDFHKKFTKILETKNIPYVVYGGVMLGLIRDGNLIEWDKDLDYGFFQKDFKEIENIILGMDYKLTTIDDILFGYYVDSSPNNMNGKLLQLTLNETHYVDFKFFKEINNKLIFDANDLPNYPLSYIENSEIVTFSGIDFRLSNKRNDWIRYDYGSNWKISIPETEHNEWINGAEDTWKKWE